MSGEPSFFTRDVLLAVGFTLLIAGIFLRGFARTTRRSLALRREHEIHLRRLDVDPSAARAPLTTSHLERNVGRYAAAAVTVGLIVIAIGFVRA